MKSSLKKMKFMIKGRAPPSSRRTPVAARENDMPPTPGSASPRVSPHSPIVPRRIQFDGMIPDYEPSTGGSPLSSVSSTSSPFFMPMQSTPSPAKQKVNDRTLAEFERIVFDMCKLTVLLMPTHPTRMPDIDTFMALLKKERIHYRRKRLPDTPRLDFMVQLRDATDMQRLLCKLPGRLSHVARNL